MEGTSLELQTIKSEPESETLDHTVDNNVKPCEHRDVKQEAVDDASFSNLTDTGGDTTALNPMTMASPLEGKFEFHAVKCEENPHPTSGLAELAGGDLVPARGVEDGSDIYDPCLVQDSPDSSPERARTSSPNHKSLVDIILPTDYVQVKLEADRSTESGSQSTSSECSPQGPPSGKTSRAHRPTPRGVEGSPSGSTHKKSPGGRSRDRAGRRGDSNSRRKRPRSAETSHKHGDTAEAKLELVALQMAIARSKLKRLKNGTSIEEAEANLRKTEHEIKLQTLKNRYKREVEKEKLRAKISKIDMEIQKCILMKKRPQRDGSPDVR